jgi:hypothetical protein
VSGGIWPHPSQARILAVSQLVVLVSSKFADPSSILLQEKKFKKKINKMDKRGLSAEGLRRRVVSIEAPQVVEEANELRKRQEEHWMAVAMASPPRVDPVDPVGEEVADEVQITGMGVDRTRGSQFKRLLHFKKKSYEPAAKRVRVDEEEEEDYDPGASVSEDYEDSIELGSTSEEEDLEEVDLELDSEGNMYIFSQESEESE